MVLAPTVDTLLLQPGARITIVHTHPDSVGLSVLDLLQLAKPGVAAIVAIRRRWKPVRSQTRAAVR